MASLALVTALGLGLWAYARLRGSLPKISGRVVVNGLATPLRIDRDTLGVPTIRSPTREGLSYGLGFLHAQERFFQMELQRRAAAGELAELFRPGDRDAVVALDREARVHQFRLRAARVVARLGPADRAWLGAYTAGVNAGLAALDAPPFEYLALGVRPRPWLPEDTVLAVLLMFRTLHAEAVAEESNLGVAFDVLPGPLAGFLAAPGTAEWDAPMEGGPIPGPPAPGPEALDLRRGPRDGRPDPTPLDEMEGELPGSNAFAVAGRLARGGGALVANDMHLKHGVPAAWYRACLVWPDESRPGRDRRAVGVTLPGVPGLPAGSNGLVAWGLTSSLGDWSDLVILEPGRPGTDTYLTPDGPRRFERHREVIRVKGRTDETLEVRTTVWGPVVDVDHRGRPRALRWTAHDPGSVDLSFSRMLGTRTLAEALELANRCGTQPLNFVAGDADGHVGWTILGRISRRVGFDRRVPTSWADGARRWDGYLEPGEAPRVVDPPQGRVWTANARVVGGEALAKLGYGGYDRGARAGQIRDRLMALGTASESDMLAIQLDDRALFLARWRDLLLGVLTPEACRADPRRGELRRHVEGWGGRASVGSVGYRMVHEFRLRAVRAALSPPTAACRRADARFRLGAFHNQEGPAWALVSARPKHLLDPGYETWDELLLTQVDGLLGEATAGGGSLAGRTWGERNTASFRHPLGPALPLLGGWLDMPTVALPGGWSDVPRIQRPGSGASQRLVVMPGREDRGLFHMPCGQSGHPLSPHYRDGHAAWVRGDPTPLLPGPAVATLRIVPHD